MKINILLALSSILSLFLLFSSISFPTVGYCKTCPDIAAIEAGSKMAVLATEIRYHNRLYYEKNQPEISDAEYDSLFENLVQLEKCFPKMVDPNSPTQTIGGAAVAGEQKVLHEQPMLSLTSSIGVDAVEALLNRLASFENVTFLVQPKVDGLPVELTYLHGKLILAATRGDGHFGYDVTERVNLIIGVPKTLTGHFPDKVLVRGEIYADKQVMQEYEKRATSLKYATPRHLASGVLKAQKPDPAAVSVLRIFPFELMNRDIVDSGRDELTLLSSWGFQINIEHSPVVKSLSEIENLYKFWLKNRDYQPFAMDGIVVKVNNLAIRQRLGSGARSPFWAAAWKFPAEKTISRVLNIKWKIGRTGRTTPIVELEEVTLRGVRISSVALNNREEIATMDIAVGDQVVVALVGDVIPQIVKVSSRLDRATHSEEPQSLKSKSTVDLDACLHDSPVCREQFLAKVTHFVSKLGLNIKGLGRSHLEKLVSAGLVVDIPSLFLLKEEQVASLDGFSQLRAQHLIKALNAASHSDFLQILKGIGISGVGPKSLNRISNKFTSVNALLTSELKASMDLSKADIRSVKIIRNFFKTHGGEEMLLKFRKLGIGESLNPKKAFDVRSKGAAEPTDKNIL